MFPHCLCIRNIRFYRLGNVANFLEVTNEKKNIKHVVRHSEF